MGREFRTRNKYGFPVQLNPDSRIVYHDSPAHVGKLKHAVDFLVSEGTPVKAALDGTVVDIQASSDIGGAEKSKEQYGNFIEIRHDNDEYSEYEHLRKDGVCVAVGDHVTKGQRIGYSGTTGWLADLGPHLHFMVGKYGEKVEDYETLSIVWDDDTPIH